MKNSRQGYTLVDKRGRVMHKRVEAVKEAIRNSRYSADAKQTLINDLEDYVADRATRKQRLTETGFFGHAQVITYQSHASSEQKVRTMIANLGYTPGELARENGIKVSDLLNPANWSGDLLTIGNAVYQLQWGYTGNALKRIQ